MAVKKFSLPRLIERALCSSFSFAEVLFFFTFFFTLCVFYPGATSPDTLLQYAQAVTGKYDDWHPPVMAFVWSWLLFFHDGPQVLLLFHLTMLFGSLWVLYKHWGRVSPWAALFLILPALPPVLIQSGAVWKDMGFAFSLLSVYAFLIYAENCGKSLKYLLSALAGLLFVYAFLLRANALFACAPLLFYFFLQKFEKCRVLRAFASSVAVVLLLLLVSASFNALLSVEKYNPTRIMRVDEIAATSVIAGKNLFSPALGDVAHLPVEDLPPIPVAKGWPFYLKIFSGYMNHDPEKEKIVYANWKDVISKYTEQYWWAKICLFKNFLFKNGAVPSLLFAPTADTLKDLPARATATGEIYMAAIDLPYPLYIIYAKLFWLAAAVGLFGYALFPRSILQQHIRALTSSAILYVLAYALVTPTPDYRFIYWTVLATLVSLVLFVMDRATLRRGAACSHGA